MALTPEEQAELDQLLAEESSHAAPAGYGGAGGAPAAPLEDMLDPSFDLPAQALAVQPGTTHPGGDEAAASEYLRKPAEASKGTVFVYEPPLSAVQRRLAEDPAFAAALSPSLPPDQARIAGMTREDSLYQMAADQMWRETADEAAKGGKTAYRYSRAPWLQSGGAMEALRGLGMKAVGAVGPAMDTVNSFVMGVDKTGLLGAGRAVQETMATGDPKVVPGIEQAGIPVEGSKEYNERTIEENPAANVAGQGLALLKPWGAANALFRAATSVAGKGAAAAGGGLAARAAAGGVGAAVGAGAVQAGQDVVAAGGNLAQTGSPGITGGELASRAGSAAVDPLNVGLGAGGEVLGTLAGKGAEWFREGARYGGAPGRFERLGGEFRLGSGPVPPKPVAEAVEQGKKLDVKPVDPIAKEIAPKIAEAQKAEVHEVIKKVEERKAPYLASREGNMKLPVTEVESQALKELRSKHHLDERRGHLVPTNGKGDVDYTRKFFNRNIDAVSTKPVEGAIELSADEAQVFLDGYNQRALMENLGPSKPPGGGGGGAWKPMPKPGTGAPSARPTGADEGSLAPEAKNTLDTLRPGKDARAAKETVATGGRDVPRGSQEAIEIDPVREARPAMQREARRMEALDKETAGPASDAAKDIGIAGAGAAATVAASDDKESSAAGAGAVGLAMMLKRKGIEKVYVLPKRYTAKEHETLLHGVQELQRDPKTPEGRQAAAIYHSALRDRDARPMNGEPGGWSRFQNENSRMIDEVKKRAELAAPGGDSFGALVDYAQQRPGQLPSKEALEAAAQRAGVRPQLDQLRLLDPMQSLQTEMRAGASGTGRPLPSTVWGTAGRFGDAAMMRLGYPAMRTLAGPLGPIRGGMAGRAGAIDVRGTSLDDEKDKTP